MLHRVGLLGLAGVGSAGGLPPSLDLSFLTPGTLDPRITFTRASTATYFDVTGTMQSAAINAPRWDYNPGTLALNGLLIEEARTNGVQNGNATGSAPGTPGTMPTNWTVNPNATGLSVQVVGSGTESGIPYVDIRVFGTATGTSNYFIVPGLATEAAALTGQTWTYTQYMRLVAGTLNGVTTQGLSIRENTSAGALVRDNNTTLTSVTGSPLNTQRFSSGTITLSGGATTAFVQPRSFWTINSGAVVNMTLRIGAPQLEQGAFPTSYIPTVGATVTRAGDSAIVASTPWYNASASTLATEYIVGYSALAAGGAANCSVQLDNTTQTEVLVLRHLPTTIVGVTVFSANAVVGSGTAGVIAAGVVSKHAAAFNSASLTTALTAFNGAAAVSFSMTAYPSGLNRLVVGAGRNLPLGGWIRRLRYWNRALSAAELQSVTT